MFKKRETNIQDYFNFITVFGVLFIASSLGNIVETFEYGTRIQVLGVSILLLVLFLSTMETLIFTSIQLAIKRSRHIKMKKELESITQDTKANTKENE